MMDDIHVVVITAIVALVFATLIVCVTIGCVVGAEHTNHLREVRVAACQQITDPGYRALCIERA